MKRLVLGVALSIALVGCTTTETVVFDASQTQQEIENFAQVDWVEITPTKRVNFAINELNQKLTIDSGTSYIAGFEIDTMGKELDLEIVSHFKSTVFFPNALLLNEQNQIVKRFGSDEFEYKHAYAMDGDRLTTTATIQPVGVSKVKLLIFTTPELTEGESEVIHPAKLDAIARSNYPPDIPNPMIPHSKFGQLSIVAKVDEAIVVEEAVVVDSSDVAHKEAIKQQAEVSVQADVAAPVVAVVAMDSAKETSLTKAQQQYYLDAIDNAVKADFIDKALALLDEAKALGVEGAQEAFVKAVNAK